MENISYHDFCRILGQLILEHRVQLDKLQKENAELVRLLKEVKQDNGQS